MIHINLIRPRWYVRWLHFNMGWVRRSEELLAQRAAWGLAKTHPMSLR